MRSNTVRYHTPSILVHWCVALVVLMLMASGWYVRYGSPTPSSQHDLAEFHIALGVAGAALILLQCLLRLIFKPPPFPDTVSAWQRWLAQALILTIYVSLALMFVSGYLELAFNNKDWGIWGIPLPTAHMEDRDLVESFRALHANLAWILAGLIVVHVSMVLLNLFKHPEIAARMLFAGTEPPDLSGQAKEERAESVQQKVAPPLAKNLRILGWIGFWSQLALAFASGILLIFSTSGRAFSPTLSGIGDALYWSIYGFYLVCLGLILALGYARFAAKFTARVDWYLQPDNRFIIWFLGAGILTGVVGILVSFTGVALSISLLIAKTVSQPPGIAITDPNKIIRALDVFILLVNFNLLVAHFIGTATALWLTLRASHARQEYVSLSQPAAEVLRLER